MKGKTTVKNFLILFRDRISPSILNGLTQQHIVPDSSPFPLSENGKVKFIWVDRFFYLEDITESEFVKNRGTGKKTWDEFEILRNEFFKEYGFNEVSDEGNNHKPTLLPNTVQHIDFLHTQFEQDKISLGTLAVNIMLLGSFAKQVPQIKHFLPVRNNDFKQILKEPTKDQSNTQLAIDYKIALKDVIFYGYFELIYANETYSILINRDHKMNLMFNRENESFYFSIGSEPIRTIDELAMGNPLNDSKYFINNRIAKLLKLT